jgi:hypothetical protein
VPDIPMNVEEEENGSIRFLVSCDNRILPKLTHFKSETYAELPSEMEEGSDTPLVRFSLRFYIHPIYFS